MARMREWQTWLMALTALALAGVIAMTVVGATRGSAPAVAADPKTEPTAQASPTVVSATPTATVEAEAAAAPTITVSNGGAVTWSFTVPAGATFSYSEVRWRASGTESLNDWTGKLNKVFWSASASSYQIPDLVAGTVYKAKVFVEVRRADGTLQYLKSPTIRFFEPAPLTMALCRNIITLQEKAQVTTDVVPEGGPCLATVSEGSETELILEWAGGPTNATKWQYRQRTFRQPWPAWTDIPGSGANTVRHRVSGLKADSGYFFEVRAWTEAGPGTESNEADGVTTTRRYADLPLMLIGQVVEGGRSWVLGGNVIVDIPLGVRVMHSSGALSARTVVFTMSEIESMSAQVFDLETGEAAGRVIRGVNTTSAGSVTTVFDQILASVRLVP